MSRTQDKYELLFRYLKGQLDGDEKKRFEKALLSDPELARTADFLSGLLSESDAVAWDKIKDPAHRIFERLLSDHKSSKDDSRHAVVTFDSKYLPLPDGVRPAIADTRRIKYRIAERTLEISLYPVSPGSFEMIGQLSGSAPGDILQIELRKGRSGFKVNGNSYQLFRFERVPGGKYKMIISRERKVIAKVDIEL
jgi:hypothetical protein